MTRLTVKNSVEERIIILQERKMELAKAALGDAGEAAVSRDTPAVQRGNMFSMLRLSAFQTFLDQLELAEAFLMSLSSQGRMRLGRGLLHSVWQICGSCLGLRIWKRSPDAGGTGWRGETDVM